MAPEGRAAQFLAIIELWTKNSTTERECRDALNDLIRGYSKDINKAELRVSKYLKANPNLGPGVREHMVPVKVIIDSLMFDPKYQVSQDSENRLYLELQLNELLREVVIAKDEDKRLTGLGLKASMPEVYDVTTMSRRPWRFGDSLKARYTEAAINIDN